MDHTHVIRITGCRLLCGGVSLNNFKRIKPSVKSTGEEYVVVEVHMRAKGLVGIHGLDVSVQDGLHTAESSIAEVT